MDYPKAPDEERVTCDRCGEEFDIAQEGYGVDCFVYCENCAFEELFRCALCEGMELEARKGGIGTTLIVNPEPDDDPVGVPRGIYRIIRHPYYWSFMIGRAEIEPNAVKRLGGIGAREKHLDLQGYPCGHLCRYCDPKVQRRTILFRTFNLNQGESNANQPK